MMSGKMITVWEDEFVAKAIRKYRVSGTVVSALKRTGLIVWFLFFLSFSLAGAAPQLNVKKQDVPKNKTEVSTDLNKIIDFQIKAFQAFKGAGDLDKDGETILELLKGRGEFAELWAGSISVRRTFKKGKELDAALLPLIESAASHELWDTVWMLYRDLTVEARTAGRALKAARLAVFHGTEASFWDLPETSRKENCFQKHMAFLDSCFGMRLKKEAHESICIVANMKTYEDFVAACKAYMCKRGRLAKITQAFWRAIDLKSTGDWNRGSLVLFTEVEQMKEAEKTHLKKRLLFDDYLPIQDCILKIATVKDGPTAAFCKFHGSASQKLSAVDDWWLLQYNIPSKIIIRAISEGLKEESPEAFVGAVIWMIVHSDVMIPSIVNNALVILESSLHSAYKSLVLEVFTPTLCRTDFENVLSQEQRDRLHKVLLAQVQSDKYPVTSGYSAIALAALHRNSPKQVADVRFSPACVQGLKIIVYDRKFQGSVREMEDWLEATLSVLPNAGKLTVEEMYKEYHESLGSSE